MFFSGWDGWERMRTTLHSMPLVVAHSLSLRQTGLTSLYEHTRLGALHIQLLLCGQRWIQLNCTTAHLPGSMALSMHKRMACLHGCVQGFNGGTQLATRQPALPYSCSRLSLACAADPL